MILDFLWKFLSELLIHSFIMSDLSKLLSVAHLSWGTWAIRSRLIICLERPERFAHSRSFVLFINYHTNMTQLYLFEILFNFVFYTLLAGCWDSNPRCCDRSQPSFSFKIIQAHKQPWDTLPPNKKHTLILESVLKFFVNNQLLKWVLLVKTYCSTKYI